MLGVIVSPASAQESAGAPLATEHAVVERYCAAGPVRSLAAALVGEGVAGVDLAAVVPNPTLGIEHNRSFTGPEDTETVAGIGFPLGIGGRRFLLSDAAGERLDQKKAQAGARLLDAALDLREALVRAVAEAERAAIIDAQQEALSALGVTLTELRKGGESSAHDLLRHSLELEVHDTRAALQHAKVASAKALIGAYVSAPVDLSAMSLASMAPDSTPPAGVVHPVLASYDAAIRAAELEEEAANRRWVPDLEIFFGYRQVTALETVTGHGFALRVGVPITFFDHGQGEAAVAAAEQASARAERDLFASAQQAQLLAANETLATLATPVPTQVDSVSRANKLLEQAKTLYLAGEGSISDLLAASTLAESSALGRVDADEALALARVARMRAVGSLFDSTLDAACAARSR